MRPILSLTVLFLSSIIASGQSLQVGYLGNNLWNPGVHLQYNQPSKKADFSIEIYSFIDPGSHSALGANVGIQTSGRKLRFGFQPIGFLQSLLPRTYVVKEDLTISTPKLVGNLYYAPAVHVQLNPFRNHKIYLKSQIVLLFPYNNAIMPNLNLVVGYTFHLKENR